MRSAEHDPGRTHREHRGGGPAVQRLRSLLVVELVALLDDRVWKRRLADRLSTEPLLAIYQHDRVAE